MYIGMSALLAESAQMNGLDYFLAVIALLAGLGAFLFGFKILSDNIMKLHEIVKFLYEKETITGEEFMQILNSSENSIEEQAKQTEAQQKALKDAENTESQKTSSDTEA